MSKTSIKPAPGYLLVEPQKKETTTPSGIVLTDKGSDKPQQGTVLSIGEVAITDYGIKKESPCKVGDVVIYREWGGKEYKDGSDELLILKFDDIMAVIN